MKDFNNFEATIESIQKYYDCTASSYSQRPQRTRKMNQQWFSEKYSFSRIWSIRIWDITEEVDDDFQVVNEIGGEAMNDTMDNQDSLKQQKPQKTRLISTYYTKNTPIYYMNYLDDRDIILAGGATEFE